MLKNFISPNGVVSPDYDENELKSLFRVENFDDILYIGANSFVKFKCYGYRYLGMLYKLRKRKSDGTIYAVSTSVPFEYNAVLAYLLYKTNTKKRGANEE